MTLFDATMARLERALDLRAARHRVIAANLANEETPGYRAKDLRFREAFAAARRATPASRLAVTHARHLTAVGPAGGPDAPVVESPAGETGVDANTVNLERELAKLADNALHYQAVAAIVAMRFQQLLAAIREVR
jgi:flagellar basal-body rod protein FlgB